MRKSLLDSMELHNKKNYIFYIGWLFGLISMRRSRILRYLALLVALVVAVSVFGFVPETMDSSRDLSLLKDNTDSFRIDLKLNNTSSFKIDLNKTKTNFIEFWHKAHANITEANLTDFWNNVRAQVSGDCLYPVTFDATYVISVLRQGKIIYADLFKKQTSMKLLFTLEGGQTAIFKVKLKYCNGNHWSDQCTKFPSVEDRKQKLIWSCYNCLKKGHRAFECKSKKICFYCRRSGHHHRSLCVQKFGAVLHENVQELRGLSQILKKGIKVETVSKDKEKDLNYVELEPYQVQNNLECEYLLTLKDLQENKAELAKSKKDNESMKEQVVVLESEKDMYQMSINRYSEIRKQQAREIAELQERSKSFEQLKNDFDRAQERISMLESEVLRMNLKKIEILAEMEAFKRCKSINNEVIVEQLQLTADQKSEHTALSNHTFSQREKLQNCNTAHLNNDQKGECYLDGLREKQEFREKGAKMEKALSAGTYISCLNRENGADEIMEILRALIWNQEQKHRSLTRDRSEFDARGKCSWTDGPSNLE